MVKKAKVTTYMQDVIALAKKAGVLHTAVIEGNIYVSIDNAVLFSMPDNGAADATLQAIGIPYVREKQGEYYKKGSTFIHDERGRKIPRASSIFFDEHKNVDYTDMIYNDGNGLYALYVQDGEVRGMNTSYMSIMHKINNICFIGHQKHESQFIFVIDPYTKFRFGAMPIRLHEENKIAIKKNVEYLFGYVRGTMEEDGEAGR